MRLLTVIGIAGLFLSGGAGYAEPAPAPVVAPRVDAATRQLQAGDVLEINISTLPELERKYPIRADGTFFHPFAGEVKASGRTLPQLELELARRFKKQLRNPTFRLSVASLAESEAAVLGEVRSQGKFKFAPGTSVMDLLAQAGGFTDKADPDGAVVLRGGKQINLNLGVSGQAELSRLEVQPGDILYVNRGKRVGVSGEVQVAGVYAISTKSLHAVEDSVKAAGGAKETAALNRVQVIRPSSPKPLEVNLLDPQSSNVELSDGDVVVVPARKAIILGAVSKPGNLPLLGSETLYDVVGQAGLGQANIDAIVVIRAADVQAGNDKKEIYQMESSLGEGQKLVNVPIRDGDLVYVPTKEQTSGNLLTNGSGLMNILFMARSLFAI